MMGVAGPQVKAKDLIADITSGRPVDYHGALVVGDLIVRDAALSERDSKGRGVIRSPVNLVLCRFAGRLSLQGVEFTAEVNFGGALFMGPAVFWSSVFSEAAIFEEATFLGDANFDDAEFKGAARFSNARFGSPVPEVAPGSDGSFEESIQAEPMGKAYKGGNAEAVSARFRGAVFGDGALFTSTHFSAAADFQLAQLTGATRLDHATFHQDVNFAGATFSGPLVLRGTRVAGHADFQDANLSEAPLIDDATSLASISVEDDLGSTSSVTLATFVREAWRWRSRTYRLAMELISDRPITQPEEDLLERDGYAWALAVLLSAPSTGTPLTVAIDAPWGAGKSSLMGLVATYLKREDALVVEFNACLTQSEGELRAGLARAVLRSARAGPWLTWRLEFETRLLLRRFALSKALKALVPAAGVFALWTVVQLAWPSPSAGAEPRPWEPRTGVGTSVWESLKQAFPAATLASVTAGWARASGAVKGLARKLRRSVADPHWEDRVGPLDEFRADFGRITGLACAMEDPRSKKARLRATQKAKKRQEEDDGKRPVGRVNTWRRAGGEWLAWQVASAPASPTASVKRLPGPVRQLAEWLERTAKSRAKRVESARSAAAADPASDDKTAPVDHMPRLARVLIKRLARGIRARAEKEKWAREAQGEAGRVVVMVDDLDRCAPNAIAAILEGINLLMDHEHCVFVLGMDMRAVELAVEQRYVTAKAVDDVDGPHFTGRKFLEKIVQVRVPLPAPVEEDTKRYVDGVAAALTDSQGEPRVFRAQDAETSDPEQIDDGDGAKGGALPSGEVESKGQLAERRQEIQDRYIGGAESVRNAIRAVVPALDPNPRQIKRFVNAYRLRAMIADERGALVDLSDEDVGRWVWATTLSPEFAEAVIARPVRLREQIDLCDAANGTTWLDDKWKSQDLDRLLSSWENPPDAATSERLVRV